jgi:hypothetical protein
MIKHPRITIEDVIVRKAGVDAADMDGEIVMMDIDRGKYYCFNSVGSRIWELIEKPLSVMVVIDTLLKEFDVNAEICQEEVLSFLGRVQNEELFTVL